MAKKKVKKSIKSRESDSNKTLRSKALMISAMKKHLGVVTDACKVAKISRVTHYEWMKTDPEYKALINDISDQALDFVESKLFQVIKGFKEKEDKIFNANGVALVVPTEKVYPPDVQAIIFYLKTKGKERGYIERKELTGKDGDPLFEEDLSMLTDDELLTLAKIRKKTLAKSQGKSD